LRLSSRNKTDDNAAQPATVARNIQGWAHFVIDSGPESALLWVVFMDADGACWTVPNPEVYMSFNWTMGRRKAEDLKKPDEQAAVGVPAQFRPSLAHQSDGDR
jgi:hypothetical protein